MSALAYLAAWPLVALGSAVGIGRWLRHNEPPAPEDITALADVVTAALAEEKARERRDVREAAWQRMGEFGDEDLESWGIELLHTDDADIAADYDGLVYAAAWLRLTSMPEPTDLGDL